LGKSRGPLHRFFGSILSSFYSTPFIIFLVLINEKKFKRVKGYREISKLIVALEQKNLDRKEIAA
jgi:hypothetical protein